MGRSTRTAWGTPIPSTTAAFFSGCTTGRAFFTTTAPATGTTPASFATAIFAAFTWGAFSMKFLTVSGLFQGRVIFHDVVMIALLDRFARRFFAFVQSHYDHALQIT